MVGPQVYLMVAMKAVCWAVEKVGQMVRPTVVLMAERKVVEKVVLWAATLAVWLAVYSVVEKVGPMVASTVVSMVARKALLLVAEKVGLRVVWMAD